MGSLANLFNLNLTTDLPSIQKINGQYLVKLELPAHAGGRTVTRTFNNVVSNGTPYVLTNYNNGGWSNAGYHWGFPSGSSSFPKTVHPTGNTITVSTESRTHTFPRSFSRPHIIKAETTSTPRRPATTMCISTPRTEQTEKERS